MKRPVRAVAIPSDRAWLDARLMTRNLDRIETRIILAAGTVTQVLGQDSDRVQVIFPSLINSVTAMTVGPFPDVNLRHYGIVDSQRMLSFKLFDFPMEVQQPWYVFDSGGGEIIVIAVRRI